VPIIRSENTTKIDSKQTKKEMLRNYMYVTPQPRLKFIAKLPDVFLLKLGAVVERRPVSRENLK